MPRSGFGKKEQLVEAALREFGRSSFEQASLNSILQEAGVSKGVFYHHFAHKEELYLHVAGVLLQRKKDYMMAHMTKEDLGGDFFSTLRSQIRLGLRFGRECPEMARFSDRLMQERGNDIFNRVMETYNANQDAAVQALIQQAIRAGDLRRDLPATFVTSILVFLLQHINEILDTRGVDDYENKVDDLLKFMESGLSDSAGRKG